jgi:hypothetical protein
MPRLSALVCVHKQDKRLAACLERLRFANEVVVALTQDAARSGEIARRLADRVVAGGAAEGVAACTGDWILEIAPDEMIGEALAEEILFVVGSAIATERFLVPVESHVRRRRIPDGGSGRPAAALLYRRGSDPHSTGGLLINSLIRHVDGGCPDAARRLFHAAIAALRTHLTPAPAK